MDPEDHDFLDFLAGVLTMIAIIALGAGLFFTFYSFL